MVGHAQAQVALLGFTEIRNVLDQVLLFARLQHHGFKQAWRVGFGILPAVVVGVEARLHTQPLEVTAHDVVHKVFQE
jgi:hypothetical protein